MRPWPPLHDRGFVFCSAVCVCIVRGAPSGPRSRSSAVPLCLADAREGDRSQLRSWRSGFTLGEGVCILQRAPFGCYASGRTLFRGSERAFALCSVPPSRTACSGGPPRLDAAPPRGWLFPSAFLASMVRVHGEVGPRQQKANPNVDSSNVTSPLGGCGVQPRGSART